MRLRLVHLTLLVLVSLTAAACGGRWIQGDIVANDARIANTQVNEEIISVMARYEDALERMDLDALFALISRDYYENAGTTDTTDDDYGYEAVTEVFRVLRDHVDDLRVDVTVREINVDGDRADVIYEYAYRLLYEVAESQRWETERDFNRIEMQWYSDDGWMIVGGL